MKTTNRSTSLKSALGTFAIRAGIAIAGFALVFAPEARAQHSGNPSAIVNQLTLAALDTGGMNGNGAPLMTAPWAGIGGAPARQQWQFFPDLGAGVPINRFKISSLATFKVADVAARCGFMAPVTQATQVFVDGTLSGCAGAVTFAFRFQRWIVTRVGSSNNFTIMNSATSMCMTDLGNPGIGGGVFQQACNINDVRQRWFIWDYLLGHLE